MSGHPEEIHPFEVTKGVVRYDKQTESISITWEGKTTTHTAEGWHKIESLMYRYKEIGDEWLEGIKQIS